MILNRAKDFYKNNKELLEKEQKTNAETYLKIKKDMKRQYQRDRHHNMTAEEKQRLKEYQKTYREDRRATA